MSTGSQQEIFEVLASLVDDDSLSGHCLRARRGSNRRAALQLLPISSKLTA
jgi:hypothetical protein